jgi:hypothetical protein
MTVMAAAAESAEEHPWDGNKSIPLHRLTLMDETGEAVLPAQPETVPMSVKQTCGACHDYDTIAKGRHFNYLDPTVEPGRMSQPWVLVDEKTGTQLPLSYRNWNLPSIWKPDQIGMTQWEFTTALGRHLRGGGAAEPATPETGNMRWVVSGGAEINCFACHNRSGLQDMSEWAKQIGRENFRWAVTGASGLGEVNGMASRQKPEWDKDQGPALDDRKYAVPPSMTYDLTQFDGKGRAKLAVGKPDDQRCLYCHSVAKAAKNGSMRWATSMRRRVWDAPTVIRTAWITMSRAATRRSRRSRPHRRAERQRSPRWRVASPWTCRAVDATWATRNRKHWRSGGAGMRRRGPSTRTCRRFTSRR